MSRSRRDRGFGEEREKDEEDAKEKECHEVRNCSCVVIEIAGIVLIQ
jgi:hypothetical protein